MEEKKKKAKWMKKSMKEKDSKIEEMVKEGAMKKPSSKRMQSKMYGDK